MADIRAKITSLYELAKNFNNAPLLKEISELQTAIAELTNETTGLKEEIRRLKFKKDNPLSLKEGIYYDTEENAYCPACYGSKEQRIPLSRINEIGTWVLYMCPACSQRFHKGNEPPIETLSWDPLE
jgi:hypothetical protein